METFAKKKVEIVAESAIIPKLVALTKAEKVPGYTVVPVLEGSGRSGIVGEDYLMRSISARMFVVVAEADVAERFVHAAAEALARYRAIILISDVRVLRDDHF